MLLAYHEAGHAVMACHLRPRFRYVTIVGGADSSGHFMPTDPPHWLKPEINDDRRTRNWIAREVMISLAGGWAEMLLTCKKGKPRFHFRSAQQDLHYAVDVVSYVVSDEQCGAYIDGLMVRTKDWVWLPRNRLSIKAVADHLLKHKRMTYVSVKKIIREMSAT